VITVLLLGLLTCVAWQILARRRSRYADDSMDGHAPREGDRRPDSWASRVV